MLILTRCSLQVNYNEKHRLLFCSTLDLLSVNFSFYIPRTRSFEINYLSKEELICPNTFLKFWSLIKNLPNFKIDTVTPSNESSTLLPFSCETPPIWIILRERIQSDLLVKCFEHLLEKSFDCNTFIPLSNKSIWYIWEPIWGWVPSRRTRV